MTGYWPESEMHLSEAERVKVGRALAKAFNVPEVVVADWSVPWYRKLWQRWTRRPAK
jgi:hypothetical protein